jgi:hypothetical protein
MYYGSLIQRLLQRRSLWDQKDKHHRNRDANKTLFKCLCLEINKFGAFVNVEVFFKYVP